MTSVQPGDWLLLQNECNALGTVMTLAAHHGMRIAVHIDCTGIEAPNGQAATLLLRRMPPSFSFTRSSCLVQSVRFASAFLCQPCQALTLRVEVGL